MITLAMATAGYALAQTLHIYRLRLFGFALIIVATVDKNRRHGKP